MDNVKCGELNTVESGELFFQEAVVAFEACSYDEAVLLFIKAYELGSHQNEIVEILYSCFITPNEEEFKQVYATTIEGLAEYAYEETRIDFIPVAEDHFYLFDKCERKFCGDIWLGNSKERNKRFHSLMFSDVGDVRKITGKIYDKEYAAIYYLMQEEKDIFYSFFKLPGFADIYLKNAVIFDNEEQMKAYFMENTDVYLPITVMGKSYEYYYGIINDISDARKACMDKERNNVFLSICIPSYNRGDILLENVKQVLKLQYDSEIEVVISNNGSTENVEGYQQIREMQDSRIKYVEFEENQGYASNVLNVLSHASGKFAMLASDEDILIRENFSKLLELLYQNRDKGVVHVTGYGNNFAGPERMEDRLFQAGVEAMSQSIDTNYLTGVIYNMSNIKNDKILESIQTCRGNMYVEYYIHVALCIFVSRTNSFFLSSFPVWYGSDLYETEESELEDKLLSYMTLKSRLEQFEGAVKLAMLICGKDTEAGLFMFYNFLVKTYFLLAIARNIRRKAFEREYIWKDVCTEVYEYSMSMAKEYQIDIFLKDLLEQAYRDALIM